jgi:hypothetical protein
MMGKIADNERVKLHATFWNNTAVGITVAAIVIPALVGYSNPETFITTMRVLVGGYGIHSLEVLHAVGWISGLLLALTAVVLCRRAADRLARRILD